MSAEKRARKVEHYDRDVTRMQEFITKLMGCEKVTAWQVNGWTWSKQILERSAQILAAKREKP